MMEQATLTTVVTNPDTLRILLKITDKLHEEGKLSSLRVVDKTKDIAGTVTLRSLLPIDGETGKKIVMVDYDVVKSKDTKATIAKSLLGYHYQNTSCRLVPDGESVTVASRSSHGSYVFISKEPRGPSGFEIVMGESSCFVRRGKGGGDPICSGDFPGVVVGGTGWRTVKLALDSFGRVALEFDNGKTMAVDFQESVEMIYVAISSTSKGSADFVVSKLDHEDMRPVFASTRNYASYFSFMPERVGGKEVVSEQDVVYLDEEGWNSIVSRGGIPLVVGESASAVALKKANIFKTTTEEKASHFSFLERSFRCVDRVRCLAKDGVEFSSTSKKVRAYSSEETSNGVPALFCVLLPDVCYDSEILEGYNKLAVEGPTGDAFTRSASDILAYVDSALDGGQGEEFFLEFIELLTRQQKEQLFNLLKQKLA